MDLLILSELIEDASISIPKLSKKININTSVAYSRIKRLVKRNVIERFTIIVNDKELGYNVKALTGISMDTKMRDHVIQQLLDLPEVREISEVTGRFDVVVTMYSRTLDEMHRLVSEKLGQIHGIKNSESFIEMKRTRKQAPYKKKKTA